MKAAKPKIVLFIRDTFTFIWCRTDQSATIGNETMVQPVFVQMWKCRVCCYVQIPQHQLVWETFRHSYCSNWPVLSLHHCLSELLRLSVTICWSRCTFPVKNQKSWKKGKIDKGTSSAGLGRVVSWPLCHVASVYPHLKFHQNYILFILCSKKGVGNFSTLKVVFNFSARNWDHYCSYLKLITY